ncbi:hypothetical protein RJ639_002893 [Escallonia herrerae]|uniref:Hydroxyproline-rich glycoprotein family protein n=1 Tax=Escallonia herrerae TaxID=1293975 RepID=A0AA88W7Q9_9ASTE|nr:hypothetical protein RJ639_002893 [Escallonia herrerae]
MLYGGVGHHVTQDSRSINRKRWGRCWGGISCFGKQKGGKRVVPASRMPEVSALANQPNGPPAVGLNNQTTALAPSLLAPPSSPASFSNSALPSTAQSPSYFLSLSANSPGGPSSTMFATGPYAHETQLVSPPVFSTFTTEPSTAPLTPPPELAHITTPSSPDVPFAQLLSSSIDKTTGKRNYMAANDLQATYALYPGSPASCLLSPVSRTSGDCLSSSFPEREFIPRWDPSIPSQETKHPRSESGRLFALDTVSASNLSQDSNFFCPATFAQFYLDPSSFPNSGGRLSVSRESDVYSNGGNGHQNRQIKTSKQDVEELEAYRASFGFSADEIVTTTQYVEISDVLDDSFTMTPFISNKPHEDETIFISSTDDSSKVGKVQADLSSPKIGKSGRLYDGTGKVHVSRLHVLHHEGGARVSFGPFTCTCTNGPSLYGPDHVSKGQSGDFSGQSNRGEMKLPDEDDIFSKMGTSRVSRKYALGLSSSDAEIDYRRGRSLREGKGDFAWHD